MPRAKKPAESAASIGPSMPPPKAAWPADAVSRFPVAKLIPYATNSRTHSPDQISQIAASIQQWGWTIPILVDEDNVIIAGHARVQAAQKLGLKDCPVMVARGWSDAKKRAYVIADNKLAINAGWDDELLKLELNDLEGSGFDLTLIGFSTDELNALLFAAPAGLTDPDDAPAAPKHPIARLGDVWVLGNHRIVCGDSTVPSTVGALLGKVRPHLMVTDPPYGVEYDAAWRTRAGVGGSGSAVGAVMNDDNADWRKSWALFPGDVAYIWHAGTRDYEVAQSLIAARFAIRAQIIWVKTRLVLSRGDYHHQHEPLFYAVKEGGEENWNFVPEHEVALYTVRNGSKGHYSGGRKQSTVWYIEHLKSDTGHSTQKPMECMKRPIENNSTIGQSVYDPFCGSGTTLIAGEISGRAVYACELNPAYVDVCVIRWQDFTGRAAVLESSGKTFAEVGTERPIPESEDD